MVPPVPGFRAAALLAAGLLLLTGCPQQDDQAPPDANVEATRDKSIEKGDEYVALGDSYTASPFTGTLDGSDDCFRSLNNYPHLVADELGLDLTDVSCGGATTQDMTSRQQTLGDGTVAPQFAALTESTDLVTVSIGGNDFDLYGTLIGTCVHLAASDPNGAPCTQLDAADGGSNVARTTDRIEDRVVAVIEGITERAPDARVIVVGYPQFMPEDRVCDQLPLAAGDYPLARRLNVLLDDALQQAADRAGAEFIDVFAATAGHDICAPDPWVAGAEPTGPAAPYHPYEKVQEVVARLIVDELS